MASGEGTRPSHKGMMNAFRVVHQTLPQVPPEAVFGWNVAGAIDGLTSETRAGFDPSKPLYGKSRNQDKCAYFPGWMNNPDWLLVIMLDGHGADGVVFSDKACTHLEEELRKHPSLEEDPAEALRDTFLAADKKCADYGVDQQPSWTSEGATAAVMLIKGPRAWVAYSGDTMVTLATQVGSELKMLPLSVPHVPRDSEEKARIKQNGARVLSAKGVDRIYPGGAILAKDGPSVSRCLGNVNFRKWGMIADCDVMDFTFSANDLFLCIATDGIHDCIHPAEMVRHVYENLKANKQTGANEMVQTISAAEWQRVFDNCYVDDATMCVCCLRSLGTGFGEELPDVDTFPQGRVEPPEGDSNSTQAQIDSHQSAGNTTRT